MAEREGFEPPIPFRVYRFSRPTVSTAHTPLRVSSHHEFISLPVSLDLVDPRDSWVSVTSGLSVFSLRKEVMISPSVGTLA
jgi:hypothetical protein